MSSLSLLFQCSRIARKWVSEGRTNRVKWTSSKFLSKFSIFNIEKTDTKYSYPYPNLLCKDQAK
ncbi:hypothetical protein T440DRAFT_275650 [Plenodomus tracheiphilus IPT5]|uniref:Uncharacterized protein n=1 Tax=Plenodomus tracheiphilus IPT5 TaxID=1408161 RepID=A0A6A7BI72_9PLEO|nr:hypothetical protein T440DRAFT_275650 [Plenodomus tracheiphilus IPT5]